MSSARRWGRLAVAGATAVASLAAFATVGLAAGLTVSSKHLSVFQTAVCATANTGFLNASAQAADAGTGFETNPTNAFADGSGFASNVNGAGDSHRYFNYGISVPSSCKVKGFDVRLDWFLDATDRVNSMSVELSWNAGTSWTAAKSDGTETTSEHTATLGGSTDTWGRTWALSELSNANFRVRVTSNCSGTGGSACSTRDFFLDWIPLKVYFGP